jgi:flagellar basal-body rod protein FlgF
MSNTNYVLLAKQQANLIHMDRVADNMANANTVGFKSEHDVFKSHLVPIKNGENISYGTFGFTRRDASTGPMQVTERPLDVAIQGTGFFKVQTPQGERYTRAGNFAIDNDGRLVTQDGYAVMGAGGGGVNLLPEDTNISIRDDGTVFSGENERGRIGVFDVGDPQELTRVGNNLLLSSSGDSLSESSVLQQGMLEGSTVSAVTEMSQMISASREYQLINGLLRQLQGVSSQMGQRLVNAQV